MNRQFTFLLAHNRIRAAISLLKQLRPYPDLPEVFAMRGRILRELGKVEEGDSLIWQAVVKRGQEIAAHHPDADLAERMLMFSTVIFLGGDAQLFVPNGQLQLQTLLAHGLEPHHKVLDVGCGCFRAGYHLIRFLDSNSYYGIEPYCLRVDFGLNYVLMPEHHAKNPIVKQHKDFSFSAFDNCFDFILARSVWTHASQNQICTMLDQFKQTTTEDGVFLTSYVPVVSRDQTYQQDTWLGRDDRGERGGYAYHSLEWITEVAASRQLDVEELTTHVSNGQIWLKITHQRS